MDRRRLSRADLPPVFTPESLRSVPVGVLRAFQRHDNGVLTAEEQLEFDRSLHELMTQIASRLDQQIQRTRWEVRAGPRRGGGRGAGRGGGRPVDRDVQRVARRIEAQLNAVEGLAPDVDWSRAMPPVGGVEDVDALPGATASEPERAEPTGDLQTVQDVEATITDQVELVAVMNDIAEVSRRTYALEQEREAASTRSVFFGFLVSVAVIMAGWAPLVTATWHQRWWILGLTIITCLVAGGVYALVRRRQRRLDDSDE